MNDILLINSLVKGGAEKVALTITEKSNTQLVTIWDDVEYDIGDRELVCLVKNRRNTLIDLVFAFFALANYLVKNPDIKVINSHLFWANYIAITLSFFFKINVVATHCVSFTSKFQHTFFKYHFHYLMSKLLLRRAAVNVFKSEAMKIEYEKKFKIYSSKVIYNPIDFDNIKRLSEKEPNFYFDENKKYILMVGRFHKTKCQEKMIKCVAQIPLNHEVIFLGEGERLEYCKNLAFDLRVNERCHFLGVVDNPYSFYRNCDYYISFSISEGFPNALLEAIFLKCYVFHSDCLTGPREILTRGDTVLSSLLYSNSYEKYSEGVLFDPFDEQSFLDSFFDYLDKNENQGKVELDSNPYLRSKNEIANEYRNLINSFVVN
ncbi:glycosyltransferase [Vibrio aestuarianus]|uniref:glycosyltransferase n=1 Tax=Vibrio aestuarianus TaxID=28171 RepID=UPI00237D2EAD|nr:glycosyltransferase [Vibrio aestuarianus]MDE1335108.1 glycosyltransferase [Vibrio aestuarianus]